MRFISDSYTRPANTTAYAAGDVINNSTSAPSALEFENATGPGGSALIVSALLVDGANQSTKADLELWLFNTAPTMDNDNAAFTPTDTELQSLLGVIDFGASPVSGDATSGAGGNAVYQAGSSSNLPLPVKCASGVTSIYGVLVVRNAYTPVSAGTFFVRLGLADE